MPSTRPPSARRYRPLRFGVEWERRGSGFWASFKSVFRDPKAPDWSAANYAYPLRTTWIRGPLPRVPMAASAAWHIAAVLILLLPIWRAFPVQRSPEKYSDFHLTWDVPLPEIQPPAPAKSKGKTIPEGDPAKPLPREGADAVNPRQTILTQAQALSHPRQTLIQPESPAEAPKVMPQLPNIVNWSNSAQPPRLQLSRSMLAPILRNIQKAPVDAPEISSRQAADNLALAQSNLPDLKMPVNQGRGPVHIQRSDDSAVPQIENQIPSAGLNIAPSADSPSEAVKMPVAMNSAHAAPTRRSTNGIEAAPEIGRADLPSSDGSLAANAAKTPQVNMPVGASSGPIRHSSVAPATGESTQDAAPTINAQASGTDQNLGRVIALSTTPGPPKPNVQVPRGNLSARTSAAPVGPSGGVPGGSRDANASPGSRGGAVTASAGVSSGTTPGGNGGAGPSGVSIATSKPGATSPVSGGAGAALNLHPPVTPPEPAPVNPMRRRSLGPGDFDNGTAPEKIFGDKRMYTLFVNLPNLTSASGSWVLNFAQLQPNRSSNYSDTVISSPVPVRKVDPKYPTSLMSARVEGEVVLYAIIRADGSVDSIQVLKSLDPQLDRNAIEAVVRWKFSPAMQGGTPVDIEAVIHIPFRAPSEF